MERETLAFQINRFLGIKHNSETRAWYAKYLKPMILFMSGSRMLTSITRMDAEAYWQVVRSRKTWLGYASTQTHGKTASVVFHGQ